MSLFTRRSKSKESPPVPPATAQPSLTAPASILDDLVDLEPLAHWKQELQRLEGLYRQGQAALVAARRQVKGIDPLPEPDLTWHIQRELLAAAGDAEALAVFDREHGADIEAELDARRRAVQGGAEAKARVTALTTYLKGIARQMAELSNSGLQRKEMKRIFLPSAQRMLAAAQAFAQAHREMETMATALLGVCRTHESYVDGSSISTYGFELIERRDRGAWLSTMIEGLGYDELYTLNRTYERRDDELSSLIYERLAQAGLDTQWVNVYHPGSDTNPRQIYAPDPNPPSKQDQYVTIIH